MTIALITLGYTAPFTSDRARIESAIQRIARSLSTRLGWR
jgi:hypothetical protein